MDMKKGSCEDTCYTLLEASGDSEADLSYPIKGENYTADDDAQSCSYDASDICDAAELNKNTKTLNPDGEDKKNDNSFTGTSYCEDGDEVQEHNYKSCVSDDSRSHELLDEAEKNRLFWEACLAS